MTQSLAGRPLAALLPRLAGVAACLATFPAAAQTDLPPAAAAPAVSGSLLPTDLSVGTMFHNADLVVQAVLVGLIVLSVGTWTVLFAKGISLLLAKRAVRPVLAGAEAERTLGGLSARLRDARADGIAVAMVAAAAKEMSVSAGGDPAGIKERVASRLARLEAAAARKMTHGVGLLATIGSTAPFIGLFGTVWGIMNSFIGIAHSQTTNLAVVAPGIAEALLTTAAGLAAAIPAVVIYNLFTRSIGGYRAMLADLSAAVLRLVSRELDQRHGMSAAAE